MRPVPSVAAYCPSCDPEWAHRLIEFGHLINPDVRSSAPNDWAGLIRIADASLLTPFLPDLVSNKSLSIPEEGLDYLRLVRQVHSQRSVALHHQLTELVMSLEAHNITPVLLKGAAILALESEPGESGRAVRDLDILIQKNQIDLAAEVLLSQGYCFAEQGPKSGHHLPVLSKEDKPAVVELHHHPVFPELWKPLLGTPASQYVKIPFGGVMVRVLSPLGRVAMAVIGSQLQDSHFRAHRVDLRRLHDVLLLTKEWSEEWQTLDRIMTGAGYQKPFHSFLAQLATIFGAGPDNLTNSQPISRILLAKFCCARLDKAHQTVTHTGMVAEESVETYGPALSLAGGLAKALRFKLVLKILRAISICLQHRVLPFRSK